MMTPNMPTGETMSEGSAMPPEGSQTPAQPASGEITLTVPLTSLAMPGEDEQLNNPAQGDPVQFHAEGKVLSVQGETAVVSVASVNGKPLTAKAAAVTNTPDDDAEYAQLKQMAGQQGGMQ